MNNSVKKSFAEIYPQIAEECYWDDEKNYPLQPHSFDVDSEYRAYMNCTCGHGGFRSPINYMVLRHEQDVTQCPDCLYEEENETIEGQHRIVYEEWDTEANGFPPDDVKAGSELLAHWKCKFGHQFQETVKDRIFNDKHCAECCKSGLNHYSRYKYNQLIGASPSAFLGFHNPMPESLREMLEGKDDE